jgi:serine/threonine protein kinase
VRNEPEANAGQQRFASGEPGSNADLESLVGRIADEFAARYARGERPTIEEYVQRYPEAGATLREVLATAEAMCAMSKTGTMCGPEASVIVPPTLGDFQIIREIARGGMGTVYEARQVSLNRRVALKVLPFTALLDERQLQRFQNEAQAAACLHHTHIVPVHAVGRDGNTHFYAMQYIDGQSLAQILSSLRNARGAGPETGEPAPSSASTAPVAAATALTDGAIDSPAWIQQVARWGIDAAEALDYAHTQGIVHRDIKPGNLLIDGAGEIWITDFGLARRAGEANLTKTGDMVGTLRYMSPEQVQSQRPLIDHRSDIYALGATLYELLTLQPLFAGSDPGYLVRQIIRDDPCAPGHLNRSLPKDLETIVLKAIEKDPATRYPTTKALADDLRRFLDRKPISARRATAWERVVKWSRRNAAPVTAALAVLIVCSAVLAGSTTWVSAERNAARKAEANERTQAERSKNDAAIAELQRRVAEAESRRAHQNFQNALNLIDELTLKLFFAISRDYPEAFPLLSSILRERCLDFYSRCTSDSGRDEAARFQTAIAYSRMARIRSSQSMGTRAAEDCRTAIAILEELKAKSTGRPDLLRELAGAQMKLSESLFFGDSIGVSLGATSSVPTERLQASLAAATAARSTYEEIIREFGRSAHELHGLAFADDTRAVRFSHLKDAQNTATAHESAAQTFGRLATMLADEPEAVLIYQDFNSIRLDRNSVLKAQSMALGKAGSAYRDSGNIARAELLYRQAIDVAQLLPAVDRFGEADSPDFIVAALQELLETSGRSDEAMQLGLAVLHSESGLLKVLSSSSQTDPLPEKRMQDDAWTLGRPEYNIYRVSAELLHGAQYLRRFGHEREVEIALKSVFEALESGCRIPQRFAVSGSNPGKQCVTVCRPYVELLLEQGRHDDAQAIITRMEAALNVQRNARVAPHLQKIADVRSEEARLCLRLATSLQGFRQFDVPIAKIYKQILADDARLATDPREGIRYNAACAGALAGTSANTGLEADQRAEWRTQAVEWLQADLRALHKLGEDAAAQPPVDAEKWRGQLVRILSHWQKDTDLAGIREASLVAALPEAERAACDELWHDVEALLSELTQPAATE